MNLPRGWISKDDGQIDTLYAYGWVGLILVCYLAVAQEMTTKPPDILTVAGAIGVVIGAAAGGRRARDGLNGKPITPDPQKPAEG